MMKTSDLIKLIKTQIKYEEAAKKAGNTIRSAFLSRWFWELAPWAATGASLLWREFFPNQTKLLALAATTNSAAFFKARGDTLAKIENEQNKQVFDEEKKLTREIEKIPDIDKDDEFTKKQTRVHDLAGEYRVFQRLSSKPLPKKAKTNLLRKKESIFDFLMENASPPLRGFGGDNPSAYTNESLRNELKLYGSQAKILFEVVEKKVEGKKIKVK